MGATRGAVRVRRNAWTPTTGDAALAAYALGVEAMRGRDASDPTSWAYQAAIHGTHATPVRPLWNGCQHGGWFFLSWHRMYLWFFERIVRAAVVEAGGPDDWALPFWDYDGGDQQASIPLAFREPLDAEGNDNPLFVAERRPGINEGGRMRRTVTSPRDALARTQFVGGPEFGGGISPVVRFWGETGRVEQTPHNDVHNVVNGLMADDRQAALDPIFWLHHANVDRLWFEWASRPGNVAPADPAWTGERFAFFDEQGQEEEVAGGDVVDTAAQLGYTYEPATADGLPPAEELLEAAMSTPNPPDPPNPELVGASEKPVRLTGMQEGVTVAIDQPTLESLGGGVEGVEQRHVYLNVEDIAGERNPGTVYGIYVNLPDEASEQEAAHHHVGNVSFFGIERSQEAGGDEPPHGLRVSVEISGLARELAAEGLWDEAALHVTFRPLQVLDLDEEAAGPQHELLESAADDPPVQIGRVSVFYA